MSKLYGLVEKCAVAVGRGCGWTGAQVRNSAIVGSGCAQVFGVASVATAKESFAQYAVDSAAEKQAVSDILAKYRR